MSLLQRFNRAMARGVRAVAESPWVKFLTGVVLLTSSLDEAIDTLAADLTALELGAHHGVMLLGFVNILSALPDMLDGLVGTLQADDDLADDDQIDDDQIDDDQSDAGVAADDGRPAVALPRRRAA